MHFLSDPHFWTSWLRIVLIDLLLAGDNALVIALAVRSLPAREQFWGRVFGTGGAETAAKKLDMPFLGAVPLVMSIRETSDTGQPVVVSDFTGPEAEAFKSIAHRILAGTPLLRS